MNLCESVNVTVYIQYVDAQYVFDLLGRIRKILYWAAAVLKHILLQRCSAGIYHDISAGLKVWTRVMDNDWV